VGSTPGLSSWLSDQGDSTTLSAFEEPIVTGP
jgi:hypothetical protein